MAGNPTSLKGVRNNTQIRIGVPMRAYASAENAINRTNPSIYWIPVQEAIAWANGGFTAQEAYWPAVSIKFNLAGETGYWANAWINTLDNAPLANISTVTCSEYTITSATQSITLPITVTTHSPGVTHDVEVLTYIRNTSTWQRIKLWSNVAASQTWSLTATERNALLSAFAKTKSEWIRVVVSTKSDGHTVGSNQVDAIVNITYLPTLTTTDTSEGNTQLATALTGGANYFTTKYLKDHSVIRISASSLVAGTTLKELRLYYDGRLISTHTFAAGTTNDSNRVLTVPAGSKAGSLPLRIELEDHRGNILQNNRNLTVLDYSPVSLTGVQVRRASNASGTLNEAGTYLRLDCYASWSKVTGYGTNLAKVYVRYREVGQTTWIDLGDIDVIAESGSITNTFTTAISAVKSYEVNVYMRDKVPEVQSSTTVFVGTQRVPFSIGKDIGVGVGKIHEAGALDIASIQDNRGGVAIDGVLQDPWPWLSSQGIIPAGTNFNNLKDGKHFFYPDAGSFVNAPNTGQGMLISQTMNRDGVIIKNQQLWSLEGLTSRHHQQGTWFPWTKFYTDQNLSGSVVQKYPDGTMIIEGVASITGAITVAWGTSLFYANFTLDFPGQFHSVENMIVTISSSNSALVMGALPSLSYATIILARPMNTPSQTYDVSYRVKGRWKA